MLTNYLHRITRYLCAAPASYRQCKLAEKELRETLSEKQIDRMIEDSFPASDPPSTY